MALMEGKPRAVVDAMVTEEGKQCPNDWETENEMYDESEVRLEEDGTRNMSKGI
jgi:hypothetical protein